jgi:hypothetical protein
MSFAKASCTASSASGRSIHVRAYSTSVAASASKIARITSSLVLTYALSAGDTRSRLITRSAIRPLRPPTTGNPPLTTTR